MAYYGSLDLEMSFARDVILAVSIIGAVEIETRYRYNDVNTRKDKPATSLLITRWQPRDPLELLQSFLLALSHFVGCRW